MTIDASPFQIFSAAMSFGIIPLIGFLWKINRALPQMELKILEHINTKFMSKDEFDRLTKQKGN